MKMIKLNACIYDNVGDDLMVEVLLTRYPQYKFYYDNKYYSSSDKFLKYPNFVNPTKLYRRWGRLNYIVNLIPIKKWNDCVIRWVRNRTERKCRAAVYIGGSIYIEKDNESPDERIIRERKKLENGPLFVIGANFGPYYNPEFKEKFHRYFSECAGVCFRERGSFQQFSNIPHVTYAPDVVFNYPVTSTQNRSNTVAISVIDFHNRVDLSRYEKVYNEFICDICRQCVFQGKTPILIAFCKYEGDDDAVNAIYQSLDGKIKEKTQKMFYSDTKDAKDIIDVFRDADFVLATRFHAMILALKLRKPFFCVSYNQKIENVLCDLNSTSYCLPEQISEVDIQKILNSKEEIQQLDEYVQRASLQFRQLDDFMVNS